jgi:voltage-gated sodium channel
MNKGTIVLFVEGRSFQLAVNLAILLCSILLGVETYFPDDLLIFTFFDIFITTFFLLEIIFRLIAAPDIKNFFKLISIIRIPKERAKNQPTFRIKIREKQFWNCFDTLIILITIISLFEHFFEHPEFLLVSRLFRVVRVLRLFAISKELMAVEKKIISIIPTVFSFGLLLGILLYIYSIVGVYIFHHAEFENADFSNLQNAYLTLFQIMTLDGWSDIMNTTSSSVYSPLLVKMFFVSFVIMTAIISFNVFVAVLTSQVHDKMRNNALYKDFLLTKEINQTEQALQMNMTLILNEIQSLKKELESLRANNQGNINLNPQSGELLTAEPVE